MGRQREGDWLARSAPSGSEREGGGGGGRGGFLTDARHTLCEGACLRVFTDKVASTAVQTVHTKERSPAVLKHVPSFFS